MGFSEKSEIIERGKNLLVLRNKDKSSHNLTIEMSGVSKSFFSPNTSLPEGSDSNLLLTTKTVQACLRDFFISCDGATSEAVFNVPLNTAFKLIIDDVEYYFTNIQDYLQRAKNILPVHTDVMILEDMYERATDEAGITLEPNTPFKIIIDGEEHVFNSIQELIDRAEEFPDLSLIPFVHTSEIPVNVFDLRTSKNYPIVSKENFAITSNVVTEAQKHLILSPSLTDNFVVGSYTPLDAYIRVDGEKLSIDTATNIGKDEEDANYIVSQYKANDVVMRSPLVTYDNKVIENFSTSHKVLDPMLRDNLIVGYSNPTLIKTSHKVFDVSIFKDVHDGYISDNIKLDQFKIFDPEIREHAYEVYDKESKVSISSVTVGDATTRDMLVISKDDINSVVASSKVNDVSIRDHAIVANTNAENLITTHTVLDPVLKADLKITETSEEFKLDFSPKEPILAFSRHENFDTINSVNINFSIFEPVITGDTIVPIECSGSKPVTETIAFNGKFNVLLDNVKLNSQAMTIEEIKVLLANYNIRIDITT